MAFLSPWSRLLNDGPQMPEVSVGERPLDAANLVLETVDSVRSDVCEDRLAFGGDSLLDGRPVVAILTGGIAEEQELTAEA